MPQSELGASSFEFYEGIRIFIPGAVVVGLYAAIAATFGFDAPDPAQSFVGAAFGSLVIGLLLYYLDLPVRSTTYRTELPDEVIADWSLPDDIRKPNFYFMLLDVEIPSGIRNRALYMGSMFRIGFELIYLLFLTATSVISVAVFVPDAGVQRSGDHLEVVFLFAAGCFVLLWVGCMALDLFRPPGGGSQTKAERRRLRLRELASQIGRRGGAMLIVALAAAVTFHCSGLRAFGAVAIALPAGAWAIANFKGYRRGSAWDRISLPVAVLWTALTGAMLCLLAASHSPARSPLGIKEAVGWSLAALSAAVILQSRGPEKKLRGSYWTQRTWLKVNELKLKEKYNL
jgi:hypothetical protein